MSIDKKPALSVTLHFAGSSSSRSLEQRQVFIAVYRSGTMQLFVHFHLDRERLQSRFCSLNHTDMVFTRLLTAIAPYVDHPRPSSTWRQHIKCVRRLQPSRQLIDITFQAFHLKPDTPECFFLSMRYPDELIEHHFP